MSLVADWTKTGASLQQALEQHTEQLAERKQADADLNVQVSHLTNAVHEYRRELREYIDHSEMRWAALFEHLNLKDPCRG